MSPVPRPQLEAEKLTPVDGLSVEDNNALFWGWEMQCFRVQAYPSGLKVYIVQSRLRGESTRITLVPYAT